ncbi:MAG: EAL domain-containing protein [Lachnospiraceae bacterium]|nr:EAL domain-containing protein [Lachnospiraceae bacterium]
MSYEYAYELAGLTFLLLVLISYTAKNWLPLRANQLFHWLINIAVLFTVLDMAIRAASEIPALQTVRIHYVLGVLTTLGILWMVILFFVYFLALTEHIKSYTDNGFLGAMCPAGVISIAVLLTPWTHFIFYYDKTVHYHRGPGSIVFLAVVFGYVLAMCILAFSNPHIIRRMDAVLTVMLAIIHGLVVLFQFHVLQDRYLLMFYSADFMVVVCYLVFQNMDRFSDRVSGGFSRAGFRKVVREKCLCQEAFGCLFISIQNYQNITSICVDGELYEVMGEIGVILRRCGGRHNQYHIHGADFAVMQKTEEDVLSLFQEVSQRLPAVMRVNNRNIAINYDYYMLTLEEASYNQDDFFNIMSSMKKMLKEHADGRSLMRFDGVVKEEILLELLIGRKLKRILSDHQYELRFLPIVDAKTGKCNALEILPFMTKENGEIIPEENVWQVAKEMGCIKEIGRIVMENTLRFAAEEKLFEKGIERIHINITPVHIGSESVMREYRNLADKYQISMDKLCMEMTEDMSVSQEVLGKYLNMLKKSGVRLMLDRYGENICNLQSIMNMPFDMVKINRQMLHRYCHGESEILEYQIKMLKESGWTICLDGVDTGEQYQKVTKLEVECFQGNYFSRPLSPERLHIYMEDSHGISHSL